MWEIKFNHWWFTMKIVPTPFIHKSGEENKRFHSFSIYIFTNYSNTCTVHLLLFCAMTNKCTIVSQIIILIENLWDNFAFVGHSTKFYIYIYTYIPISLKRKCACGNLRIRLPPPTTETKVQKIAIWIISDFFVYYFLLCSSLRIRLITAWNDWMTVNIELERTRKEVTMAHFKFYKFSMYWRLSVLIEKKNHETPRDNMCVCVYLWM